MSHAERDLQISTLRPLWQRIVCSWANRIAAGRLTLRFEGFPDHVVSGSLAGPHAVLHILRPKAVFRIMMGGTLGFAQAYMDEELDTPDLGALLELAVVNEMALSKVLKSSAVFGAFARLRHLFRRNSKKGSRRNIAFHYDLGNEFYKLWLDRTMTYSSALYETPGMSLAEAQEAKYERIVRELEIGPEDHVLEIGCGWGGFAEYAMNQTGCRVTGLTLSTEQAVYARARLERAGLGEKADIRLEDYRDCRGQFDKIVSIEMFEAVGEENWSTYFAAVHDLLAPGGQAMVQTITIDETRYERYRRGADFIQTFIFPGGMLPSVQAFKSASEKAALQIADCFRFGKHYDRTLLAWDQAFTANWKSIQPLGFDRRFYRMWQLYLHYCAVGFRHDWIDVVQFRMAKP